MIGVSGGVGTPEDGEGMPWPDVEDGELLDGGEGELLMPCIPLDVPAEEEGGDMLPYA